MSAPDLAERIGQRICDDFGKWLEPHLAPVARLAAALEQAEAALAAAREDTARLDWLLARGYVIVPMGNFAAAIYDDRAAIDAARKAQP